MASRNGNRSSLSQHDSGERPLAINLNMDFGEKSKVMEVLNRAYAGSVVDKHIATAAIREFEGILDDLYDKPPKWEMVTMRKADVDQMRQIIKFQDQKIQDITDRYNLITEGDPSRRPMSTKKSRRESRRRLDLADRFRDIYDNEWKAAYSELSQTMRWQELEVIYSLMRVIRNACDLCINLAEDQMDKLVVNMEDCMLDPLNGTSGGRFKQAFKESSGIYTDGMKTAERYALDYRAERADASALSVVQLFLDTKLRAIIDPRFLRKDFRRYIEKVVEVVWLMTSLDPPMRLYWQQQTERINTDFFHYYDRKGDFVNQTVWPAVFLHNTGKILNKGYTLSM